ncbi:MAG: serine hydrolase domain-containing protein [Tsuneonella sp.]
MAAFKLTPIPASEAGFSPSVLGELDSYVESLVANGELPGQVMLLARGDKLVHTHVTGFANWGTKAPLHPDTIFTLFSMSKPLTAAAMLFLHEDGKWDFDDPVSKYLPEFAGIEKLPGSKASRPPTIRETFTHTAGFSFGKTIEEMTAKIATLNWADARSLPDLIGKFASAPLDYEPGTSWEYSVATDLQAEIVERLSGERVDLFLKKRLFDPLGMVDTAFALDDAQSRRLASGHVLDAETGRLRPATMAERRESVFPMGGTSYKSTALDFARFARMLLNRGALGDVQVLRPETVDLMLQNHLSDAFCENRYAILHYTIGQGNGHGLNGMVCVDPERAGRPVGKGTYEWGGAFSTWFWIDPEHDILCVGMSHRSRIPTELRPPEVVAQELVYRALREA